MASSIIFDPLLPWLWIGIASGVSITLLAFALWRRLSGWLLRGVAAGCVLLALANPSLQREDRSAEPDIVMVVVDETSSQGISNRTAQNQTALEHVQAELAARDNTLVRIINVKDTASDGGSWVMTALSQALAEEPANRLAGVVVISDGQIHDPTAAPELGVPLHLMLTGMAQDWDRRLVIKSAPGFAILGEPTRMSVILQDQGAAPAGDTGQLMLSIDGADPQEFTLPLNQEVEVEMNLPHGGINVLQFSTPFVDGELTDRNNAAVIQINAVRDRLRVLLVSGVPHPGERTWRNLLKSDSAVDLVHFTILRPPEKSDGVPVSELSLIAFPTRELFLEKVHDFDLIIFDRYKRRGILPGVYFDSIADYVRQGGAILVAAGPDYASADSIYRTPLGAILPGEPTAIVLEEPILPIISDTGEKHPVSEGLRQDTDWGRWMRQIVVQPTSGHVLMTGKDELPLLLVDRVGEGRVALLASDHAWLWDRGFDGGGPQGELLRRLAHWSMKEPELEEESLRGVAVANGLRISRRSLDVGAQPSVEVIAPDGSIQTLALQQSAPGLFEVTIPTDELGLYRFTSGELEGVAALGSAAPREFEQTIATDALFSQILDDTKGGMRRISEELPSFRNVRSGRPAQGRGWLGLVPRDGYTVQGLTVAALLPGWAYLLFAASLMVLAWLREGRR